MDTARSQRVSGVASPADAGRKVRWGLIGCGRVADLRVAPGLSRSSINRVDAVVSRDGARAAAFAAKHGIPRSFDGLESMLADPAIDVVYVGSPNALHADQTLVACRAGKHVFCEKPLALTVAECRAMIQAADDHGVKLGVGFVQRFNPPHREARRRVQSGLIGDVAFTSAHWGYVNPSRRGWRSEPLLAGGGSLADSGVHGIDLLRFLLGREVSQIDARLDTARHGWPPDELVSAMLEFDGGPHGLLCVGEKFLYPRVGVEVNGSDGSIFLVDTLLSQMTAIPPATGRLEMVTKPGTERLEFAPEDIFQAELDAFGGAVLRDSEPEVPGSDGLRAQEVAAAIQESARLGRTVRIA